MPTLMDSIEDKYVGDENTRDYGFIVFVSESPECKKGMFPPIMTLCDFDIEAIGKLTKMFIWIKLDSAKLLITHLIV